MAATVTLKGQAALAETAPEDSGHRPGVRAGVVVERETAPANADAYRDRLNEIARRRPLRAGPFGERAADEIMETLRGED